MEVARLGEAIKVIVIIQNMRIIERFVKNDTPYLGKLVLRFEKNTDYKSIKKGYLNKINTFLQSNFSLTLYDMYNNLDFIKRIYNRLFNENPNKYKDEIKQKIIKFLKRLQDQKCFELKLLNKYKNLNEKNFLDYKLHLSNDSTINEDEQDTISMEAINSGSKTEEAKESSSSDAPNKVESDNSVSKIEKAKESSSSDAPNKVESFLPNVLVVCQKKKGKCKNDNNLLVEDSLVPKIRAYIENKFYKKFNIKFLASSSNNPFLEGDEVDYDLEIKQTNSSELKMTNSSIMFDLGLYYFYDIIILNACAFMFMDFYVLSQLLNKNGKLILSKVNCHEDFNEKDFQISPSDLISGTGNLLNFFTYDDINHVYLKKEI
jgi:hypothetical protein